ncbi:biotin carboxyl carrier protein of acetyl-CoA carboxylase, chloroplastic [Vigna unguiculata]|uniref:Biotin carboxyl carrier protein of acetyl-CoA carboxylase n=1 Tax=Vigna unguiculata TaxID=3917 RepID=A0A4D6NJW8_VIGUN|nr:biotin carboxyl carrier protein of acetyl-CoA carboxylase, chloroplastic [Vigna unguiculata]QCE12465.1 acetyl-CoA carboxylase biotin carboxyl carrier protein [Vigna unguiculata]
MASSLPPATKAATNFPLTHSFRLSPKPNNLRFPPTKPGHSVSFTRFKAQLNEVALDSSSNATPIKAKSNEEPPAKPSTEPPSVLATQESVSQFITQVASLVKLVDSRDIVELKMKQYDIELTIRKKEAMPELQPAPQPAVVYSSLPPPASPPPFAPTSTPGTATPTSPPAPKSTKSSLPPLKSPMAGTFYRSPAPAEPPFVKVGDKVKKGQVICIIEAMKLMNEIEADQSGTIVEIVAEDAKPVSVDTPLFVIEP